MLKRLKFDIPVKAGLKDNLSTKNFKCSFEG